MVDLTFRITSNLNVFPYLPKLLL